VPDGGASPPPADPDAPAGPVAVILAAGAGRRMGGPKAEIVVDGARLVDRAVATARAGGCGEVIAVVRVGAVVGSARTVPNPAPERGLASSLRLGLAAAQETDADAAIVLLVDLPGLRPAAVRRLADATDPAGPRLWFATFGGRRSHPVRIDRPLWSEVVALAGGDRGAQAFARRFPERVREVDCDGLGDPRDLDTPADLAGWLRERDGPPDEPSTVPEPS
jgi:CTP:molybdopterin cytidylyltransferase MocA